MSVKEKGSFQGAPPDSVGAKASSWMARVNDFGERYATAIIAASTVLTILTVILFASYFYNRAQNEKAEQDLSEARSIEKLKELKDKYGSTPAGPRILYRLANQYYEEGQLDDAKKAYSDFQTRYPSDALAGRVAGALRSLDKNQAFLKEDRERRMKEPKLQTHPRLLPDAKDPRFQWGPSLSPRPIVEIETATGRVSLELFVDEAPKSVAAFLKWVADKHFDGIKLDTVNGDERLVTQPKAADAIPYEKTLRSADAGSLVLVRKEGAAENLGGQFQILMKDVADLKDVTIFGAVREGLPSLKALKKDDLFKTVKIPESTPPPPAPKPH